MKISLEERKNLYPDVSREILDGYKEAEDHIWVNTDDPDLQPIRIDLPICPDWRQVEGFGKPAKHQRWKPPVMPDKLKSLVKKQNNIDKIWEELTNHRDHYYDEIEWIKRQWYHRLRGYWFFNNGVPTYIDGWQYFFLSFWHIDIGLPKYRSRDRKFFLFARYCYTDTKTFKDRDDDGVAVKNKDGYYDLIETTKRVCFGFIYPKHRREGATYKADCVMFEMISRIEKAWGGLQSMNDESARKTFVKAIVSPWKKLPFFFKPQHDGTNNPKSVLNFHPPSSRVTKDGSEAIVDSGLESMINYEVADRNAYDGDKLIFHHGDEEGKTILENVSERWRVVRQCLSMGSTIEGFTIKTSTVGEMDVRGGQNFLEICNNSHWQRRSDSGRTQSGLYILFIPAHDGLEGFIDSYGNSIIDDPTEEQRAEGFTIGAKEYLEGELKIRDNNPADWVEQKRQHPTRFRDCFIRSAADSGFNMRAIVGRVNQLDMDKDRHVVTGNFYWTNGFGTGVDFQEDPEGKWTVSYLLKGDRSLKIYHNNTFKPANPFRFVIASDPFRFSKTKGSRRSKGGIAVFMQRDPAVDPDTKDIKEWVTHRFVATYNERTETKDEFSEQVLMAAIYYGAMHYGESNVPDVWDYLVRHNYEGYLKYDIDPKTYKMSPVPGFNSQTGSIKQRLFKEMQTYIQLHIEREVHKEILEQCRDITGIDAMTDFDLFTAAGGCLLGSSNNIYEDLLQQQSDSGKIDDYIQVTTYR